MSLNITNLLSTLKNFYDTQTSTGDKSGATKDKIEDWLESNIGSSLSGMTDVSFAEDNLTTDITMSTGEKITVSSEIVQNFSYKEADGKLIIFGSNLTIDMPTGIENYVEVVGISNTVNTKEKDDNICLVGYGNSVNSGGGDDTVVSIGGDNTINDAEIITQENENIDLSSTLGIGSGSLVDATLSGKFKAYKEQTEVVIGGKTYRVKVNQTVENPPDSVDISYSFDNEGTTNLITFTGSGFVIEAEDGQQDVIKIVGNNSIIYAGDEADDITIQGNKNTVHAGEGNDAVSVNGKENNIFADAGNDEVLITGGEKNIAEAEDVKYTGTSASIYFPADDNEPRYIEVNGFSYMIRRNSTTAAGRELSVSYTVNDDGVFEFVGSDFSIHSQDNENPDKLSITGDNVYIDTGDGNDEIYVEGNENVIQAGAGDDVLTVFGDRNKIYGDEGTDTAGISGENNIYDSIEVFGGAVTLSTKNEWQTVTVGDLSYTFKLARELADENDTINIIYGYENGVFTVEADDIILEAAKKQEDKIVFNGNNSKILTLDKDDDITVVGDNNYIDGWTGNDKITVTGIKNKAYGFLGDDEIIINQRDNTAEEIAEAKKAVAEKDDDGNIRDDDEILRIAKESLSKSSANKVDGEYGKDSVKTDSNSYYTDITKETEVYKSLSQQILISPDESEKEIIVDGKTYVVKNYATLDNNNPFVSTRTISYDVIDVEVEIDGETATQKQLVVKGDYISVVAKEGQDDNVKIVGDNSYLDLLDGDDYLEAQGKYNMLFAGIGNDFLKVQGSNNTINAGDENQISKRDDNFIEVTGDDNVIKGATGQDTLWVDGDNTVWSSVENIIGISMKRETLTAENKETEITVGGNTYKIEVNLEDGEEMDKDVQFTYSYDEDTGLLTIKGDKIHIKAEPGQSDNIYLRGDDCIIELGDCDDKVEVYGSDNTVKGDDGDDYIKIYGDSFKVFGGDGANTYDVMAANSTIEGNANDKMNLSGNSTNKYTGILKENIKQNLDEGVVIIDSEDSVETIRYTSNDKEIAIKVRSNVSLPAKLAGTIYANYKVVDIGDGEKQLVIEGSCISVNLTEGSDEDVNIKVIGSDNRIETFGGEDVINVVGHKNDIITGGGQNTVNVEGSKNTVKGSANIDTFNVVGDENTIVGNGEQDIVNLQGADNTYKVKANEEKRGGSIVLTKDIGPQNLIINDRVYEISMYGIEEKDLANTEITVSYMYTQDGYMTFYADNIMVRVRDNEFTQMTDDKVTNNQDSLHLVGNNCYVFSGFGADIIKVTGNNNTLDGWKGNDSFDVNGDGNKVIGFDGDDNIIITKGNNNEVDGEAGTDTLTIIEGSGNKYTNVEKIIEK